MIFRGVSDSRLVSEEEGSERRIAGADAAAAAAGEVGVAAAAGAPGAAAGATYVTVDFTRPAERPPPEWPPPEQRDCVSPAL